MGITITVTGTYEGYSLDDDETEPSIIDMEITIYLGRCAGLISFEEPEIFVEGTLRREEDEDDDDSESVENEQELAS
jgi:hypothetical protein